MSTSTAATPSVQSGTASRILREGYGPGAWHGADLKAALADVGPALAFRRPGAGRHNIAEIAVHHAYCIRSVRARLSGRGAEPFVLQGEDWFDLAGESTLTWRDILSLVDSEQQRLCELIAAVEAGTAGSPVPEGERFDAVLGITCHAIYHAGQVQLIKRLRASSTGQPPAIESAGAATTLFRPRRFASYNAASAARISAAASATSSSAAGSTAATPNDPLSGTGVR